MSNKEWWENRMVGYDNNQHVGNDALLSIESNDHIWCYAWCLFKCAEELTAVKKIGADHFWQLVAM